MKTEQKETETTALHTADQSGYPPEDGDTAQGQNGGTAGASLPTTMIATTMERD